MKTILVATDFSDSAINAAHYAGDLSIFLGVGRIIFYHSYDDPVVASEIPLKDKKEDASLKEKSLTALENLKNEFRKKIGENIIFEVETNAYPLIFGVQKLIEEWDIDLVIAGTTGKSGWRKWAWGSNTLNLASSITAPLLVIPNDIRFKLVEKIVFACDLDKVDKTTPVDYLKFFKNKFNAQLLVLNVGKEDKSLDPKVIPEQNKLQQLIEPLNPQYHYVEDDDVMEGIEDFVEDEDADLLITVAKSYGFWESLLHKSVSQDLANQAEVPLLILRANP